MIAGKTDVIGDLTAAAGEAARRNDYKGNVPEFVASYDDGIVANGVAVTLQQSRDLWLPRCSCQVSL